MTDQGDDPGSDPGIGDESAAGERPVAVTLENRLMSHGLYLTAFRWLDERDPPGADGAGIELEYEAVSEAPVVTSTEVGAVVRTLVTIGDEREWTPGRLEATSLTTDGDVRGRWHVEREWFRGLGSTLTQLEFSQRVLTTVTNNRREQDNH
ncbi:MULTISPECIES: hypothetical protein [unclassified Natrinema]|uniref:hypothetical protein n=1 Tax=unclassified Natrinema TaxID=2622230 RepID=UPI00026D51A9|nr:MULTISPECIES: hypothetical protein [unclassified Natrinema]AFO56023.1 hypothetical protein NJ7G_0775 [Natrinema sp. J7-2]